jgi:hypothetical protein
VKTETAQSYTLHLILKASYYIGLSNLHKTKCTLQRLTFKHVEMKASQFAFNARLTGKPCVILVWVGVLDDGLVLKLGEKQIGDRDFAFSLKTNLHSFKHASLILFPSVIVHHVIAHSFNNTQPMVK